MADHVNNPNLAFGYTDLQTRGPMWVETFLTSAAIAGAPQAVSIGTTGLVAESATNGTAALCIGVSLDNAASGGTVRVVLAGLAENVPCDGATAAGALLKPSATTQGSLAATATPAIGEVIAVSIGASSSNTVDAWVCKSAALS